MTEGAGAERRAREGNGARQASGLPSLRGGREAAARYRAGAWIVTPPSTTSTWPVTYRASSDARYSAA